MAEQPEIRIGDRERIAAQDRLRDAYGQGALDLDELDERLDLALRAKTGSDLVPILSDLPAPAGAEVSLAKPAADTALAEPDEDDDGGDRDWDWLWIVAIVLILGGGSQVLGAVGAVDSVTMFGSNVVTVDEDSDDLRLITIFGSTEVVVADGDEVRNSTFSLFGSAECSEVCVTTTGAPTVNGLTLFGSVEFVSQAEYRADAQDDD